MPDFNIILIQGATASESDQKSTMHKALILNMDESSETWRITVCYSSSWMVLTHCGRVTHICVGKLTIIGSDNGLSPGRRQAIIRTNAEILLIRPLGTNFSEILIDILIFSFKKMRLKVSSAKRRPFCLGLNVLTQCGLGSPDGGIGST